MTKASKIKRPRGRPVKYPMPEQIPDTPGERGPRHP